MRVTVSQSLDGCSLCKDSNTNGLPYYEHQHRAFFSAKLTIIGPCWLKPQNYLRLWFSLELNCGHDYCPPANDLAPLPTKVEKAFLFCSEKKFQKPLCRFFDYFIAWEKIILCDGNMIVKRDAWNTNYFVCVFFLQEFTLWLLQAIQKFLDYLKEECWGIWRKSKQTITQICSHRVV